jgi:hypothetical protein
MNGRPDMNTFPESPAEGTVVVQAPFIKQVWADVTVGEKVMVALGTETL